MAGAPREARVTRRGTIVALDGIDGAALGAAARELAAGRRTDKPCVSVWDASGIFNEVELATVGAGDPSARTLLLLYAADLAHRVRAEIEPALDAGRLVIAAPYLGTALAFTDAIGLDERWVAQMLSFAPAASSGAIVSADPAEARKGFVDFCCRQLLLPQDDAARRSLLARTNARLAAR